MTVPSVPTLYDWAGGMPAFERLTEVFYGRVGQDPVLAPVFRDMSPEHPRRVAQFIAEVFGGPKRYSEQRGGHGAMIRKHLARGLTEQQRARWVALMGECADAAGLPADPEFRSAFVAYLEWGSRIAVLNSQPGATPALEAPMPHGWEPPDRVRAKAKAQSRPRTLGEFRRRRKQKWYGIRRVLVRAQEGQLRSGG